MPGFSTWGNGSYNRMAPLTPPDYDHVYSSRIGEQGYYSQHSSQYRNSHMMDGYKQYVQPSGYNAHQSYTTSAPSHIGATVPHDFGQVSSFASRLPPARSYASEATATILPPIRSHENMDPYAHYATSNNSYAQKPKEEKATGGVAAYLDYDIPTMSDFVAEMSQGIVNSNVPVEAQYRKYVSQILTSTRLPSSTIMLGLYYLASRMKILSARGVDARSRDAIYQMLTTCLLLGSKFLDDNTFQNRSWAEVSNVNVKELNKMELDWLQDFGWCIHGRMYDQHDGFYMWREHWLAYAKDTELRKIKDVQKLAPIDTNINRHRPVNKPMMSPEGPIPAQYQRKTQYDTQWVSPLISEPSPPSAAYSGPATPEYYNSAAWGYGHPSAYTKQPWTSTGTTSSYVNSRSQLSYPQKAPYVHQYASSTWNGHGHGCGCTLYSKCKDHYFLSGNHYTMQPVAC